MRQFWDMNDAVDAGLRTLEWMALTRMPQRGPVGYRQALEEASWGEVWSRSAPQAIQAGWLEWAHNMAQAHVEMGARVVTWEHGDYPRPLAEIFDAPPVLYVRGERQAWQAPVVAVVGTRRCSDDAARWAYRMGRALAQSGITLATGGAMGIDIAAVKGALQGGGRVIWCLAEGLDRVSPSANRRWAEASLERGAWVTEFPLGTAARPWRFAHRNRIVVGLSRSVVLVQSPADGGGMISARCALQYNRNLAVRMPPDNAPRWAGNHHWLLENPRMQVRDPYDWVASQGFLLPAAPAPDIPEPLQPLWEELLGSSGRTPLDLCSALGVDEWSLRHQLLVLELQGKVRSVPGGTYVALEPTGIS